MSIKKRGREQVVQTDVDPFDLHVPDGHESKHRNSESTFLKSLQGPSHDVGGLENIGPFIFLNLPHSQVNLPVKLIGSLSTQFLQVWRFFL